MSGCLIQLFDFKVELGAKSQELGAKSQELGAKSQQESFYILALQYYNYFIYKLQSYFASN